MNCTEEFAINLGRSSQRICLLDAKLSQNSQQIDLEECDDDFVPTYEEDESASDTPQQFLLLNNSTTSKNTAPLIPNIVQEEKSFMLQYRGIQHTGRMFPAKGQLTPQAFAELTSTLATEVFASKFKNSSTHPAKCTIGADFLQAVDLRTAEQPINLHMADILSFKAAPRNMKNKSNKTEALLMSRGNSIEVVNEIVCHRLQFKSQSDIREFFMTMRASFENEFKKNQAAQQPDRHEPETEDTEC